MHDRISSGQNCRALGDGDAESVNRHHNPSEGRRGCRDWKGRSAASDPVPLGPRRQQGGDKESCHVRIGSVLGSGGVGGGWGAGVGLLGVAGRDNCDIHTHAHSRREADG